MNSKDHPGLPFVTDVIGRFSPDQVHVTLDAAPRPTTPELETLIAAEWERQTRLARRNDRLLFDGPLLRYIGHRVGRSLGAPSPLGVGDRWNVRHSHNTSSGFTADHPSPTPGRDGAPKRSDDDGEQRFHLIVGPTCYRDFVGTNLFNHDRLAEFGWHRFANPVGTTATLTTRDGRICYGRRSARVAYHALHVHTFGGAFEARDRKADGSVDPFGSLCRELREELNLGREELRDLKCVGLIRDREIHQPELLFEAALDLTAAELRVRWESAESRDEHDGIVTLPDEPDAIAPFVRTCGPIAPVAVGALCLHGRLRWGDGWFHEAARKMLGD